MRHLLYGYQVRVILTCAATEALHRREPSHPSSSPADTSLPSFNCENCGYSSGGAKTGVIGCRLLTCRRKAQLPATVRRVAWSSPLNSSGSCRRGWPCLGPARSHLRGCWRCYACCLLEVKPGALQLRPLLFATEAIASGCALTSQCRFLKLCSAPPPLLLCGFSRIGLTFPMGARGNIFSRCLQPHFSFSPPLHQTASSDPP